MLRELTAAFLHQLLEVRSFRSQAALQRPCAQPQFAETGEIDCSTSLHGVAFYQLDVVNEQRPIRCHGPQSVKAVFCASWFLRQRAGRQSLVDLLQE